MGATVLSIPKNCHNCCSVNIELATNDRIYGRMIGNWPKVWICNDCGASCACHPNTTVPLGKMADKETRRLRADAHLIFDQLWKQGYKTRSQAYNWLAAQLHIDIGESHISWLTKEQLVRTIDICAEYLHNNRKALERRKLKQHAKQLKRSRKTANRINQRKKDYRLGNPRRK